ncbi:hypothetical protein BJ508DRAFT_87398 [Ascobolus immersus RN42]|uniref:Uncharacterized protein n=1 Tax=Ascobolus immersus RN42 TaxID=1160509 RepID=A0A3N4IES3_ASCIM|nr:hypothetical protein BJ508DRAFT_87398 [Ascobolus immersus RN42]
MANSILLIVWLLSFFFLPFHSLANPTPGGPISDFPIRLKGTPEFITNPKDEPALRLHPGRPLNGFDFSKIPDITTKLEWSGIKFPSFQEEKFVITPELSDGTLKTPVSIAITPKTIFSPALLEGSRSFYDARLLAIRNGISPLFQQVGASEDLATEAAPFFAEVLQSIFSEQDLPLSDSNSPILPRSILGNIWRKIKGAFSDAACTITAGASLPGFLFSAGMFDANNNHGLLLSKDQKYFVAALHGNLYRESIVVYYQATRAPGFAARASTFGKDIYTVDLPITSYVTPGFTRTMHLLLHETTHSLQYRDRGWSLSRFGWDYLFHYCKAGMSYSKNPMEVEAYNRQEYTNNLLLDSTGWGQKFFQFWIRESLDAKIGYPVERSFKDVATTPDRISELRFENGAMQITYKNGGYCYRTLTLDEVNAREYNGCKLLKAHECKTLDDWPERRRMVVERAPTAAAAPEPVPTDPRGKPRQCTKQELDERNKPCQLLKDAWKRGDRTPFKCGVAWSNLG